MECSDIQDSARQRKEKWAPPAFRFFSLETSAISPRVTVDLIVHPLYDEPWPLPIGPQAVVRESATVRLPL
jgi:hypothetical protein